MKYVYACVVGIKAPESLCYLLMYINPTLNKDYLLTYLLKHVIYIYTQTNQYRFMRDDKTPYINKYIQVIQILIHK